MHSKTLGRSSARVRISLILLALLLGVLAACGAASSAEDPETRVKNFFGEFESAINDPAIDQKEKQDEWAAKLADYAVPDQREQVKGDLQGALSQIGGAGEQIAQLTGQSDLKLRFKIEDLQIQKQSETGNEAQIEIVSGQLRMEAASGELPPELSQAIPISQVTEGGTSITMQKVDGVWYLKN